MAKRAATRLASRVLERDRLIASAVLALEDYRPANQSFTADVIQRTLAAMEEAIKAEDEAQATAARARTLAIKAEAVFHEAILGAKRQVIAQYGDDSEEIAALGLTRKSERRFGRLPKEAAKK